MLNPPPHPSRILCRCGHIRTTHRGFASHAEGRCTMKRCKCQQYRPFNPTYYAAAIEHDAYVRHFFGDKMSRLRLLPLILLVLVVAACFDSTTAPVAMCDKTTESKTPALNARGDTVAWFRTSVSMRIPCRDTIVVR